MKIKYKKNIESIINLSILFALISLSISSSAEVVLRDAETGNALSRASIFDKSGVFIGVADDEGKIPENISLKSYPLNIRYVGYQPVEITSPDQGVVTLIETTYTLPEVTIDEVSRNILYIQAYVRTYTTLENPKDTIALFKKQVVDYAIPVGKAKYKGWKKPRLLAEKEYELIKLEKKKKSTDTVSYKENSRGNTSSFSITKKFKVPEPILAGEVTEFVKDGKYSPKERWTVTNDAIIVEQDELADEKEHYYQPGILKLLGATIGQSINEAKYKFEKGEKPGVSVERLTEASSNMDFIWKGKIFKKITEQNEDSNTAIFEEMFVIDRAYISADEAKELKKDKPVVDITNFVVPEGIPAPPAEVVKLKNRVIETMKKNETKATS